jgi:glycosyltransferase involved in cell wall biosynthesis
MSKRRRILFAIGSLECGGSERQLLGILNHLDRERFEPHLYLLNRTGDFLGDVPDDVPITAFSDVPVRGLYFPGRIMRQQVAHLTDHLRTSKPDCLYDRAFLLPLVTAPATSKTGIPRVSAIVSDPDRALTFSVHRFRRFKRAILRRACRQASKIVAVSDGVREASIDYYGLDPKRVVTIANGFEFDRINQLAQATEIERLDQSDTFHIVSVGRLQQEKDFETLIAAVAKVRQQTSRTIRLTLVGDGPSRQSLEQQARDNPVQFVGFQSNPFPWMKAADLFCLTSKYEGMPNVLVEAMACGTPVISTDCPHGPREILADGKYGALVAVRDANALANAIISAMNDPDLLRQQANAATASIQQRYSMASSVGQLESLFLEL